jgi:hypothetical protein
MLALTSMLMASVAVTQTSRVTPDFVQAVAIAESNADNHAIGDGGRARTAWQIWGVAWQTANKWRARQGKPTHPRSSMHDPSVAREMATSLLEWHEHQLRLDGVRNPDEADIYMSYSMGHEGFRRIGFNRFMSPPHKLRALVRLRDAMASLDKDRRTTKPSHPNNNGTPRPTDTNKGR